MMDFTWGIVITFLIIYIIAIGAAYREGFVSGRLKEVQRQMEEDE